MAEELALSPAQVHTLMRSGQLDGIKIGKRGAWRISRRALEAYISGLVATATERASHRLG